MALDVGSRLGPYEVSAKIGEGGMGEVYRARDTKLDRDVALKVLPQAFTEDPDRLARFEREAKVLASLNHPGIAGIYGLEESGDTRALVLELVEGLTLADRIAKGPLSLDEALPIAEQIAEALEAAHEAGVIHRDLKPANIKVRDDGTVKVLDFGLAKALDPTPGGDPSQSPTLNAAATQMGVVMGTAAYMSPEQAVGKLTDKRGDIWAFGVVLFEMLTGQRLFSGDTVPQVLARVAERALDLSALPATTPPTVRRLLQRCLVRDPRQRLRDIGEGRIWLDEPLIEPAPVEEPAGSRSGRWGAGLPWGVSAALAVVVVALLLEPGPPANNPVSRFAVPVPEGVLPGRPRLSPDGRMMAFTGIQRRRFDLYRRPLDAFEAEPIEGGEGLYTDGFSPDGQSLLAITVAQPRNLIRVPIVGGLRVPIADGPLETGAWGPDGTFVLGTRQGLWLVREPGAPRIRLTTTMEGELQHTFPQFLPDGQGVLYQVWTGDRDTATVAVYDFGTETARTLLLGMSPEYAASGHLVFWRDGSLWAVGFDVDDLEVRGNPVPVVDDVPANFDGLAHFGVGADGTLAYTPTPRSLARRYLVWVDRAGNEMPLRSEARLYSSLTLSPDGRRVAVEIRESDLPSPLIQSGGNTDIWIHDIGTESLSRFTFDPAEDRMPVWTPDGERVVFASARDGGILTLYAKPADGGGDAMRLALSRRPQHPFDVSPDGQVVFSQGSADGATLQALSPSGEAEVVVGGYSPGVVSPDGQWLAHVSYESGGSEVYVRPFPNVSTARWLVSDGFGTAPVWGPDGRELFYQVAGGDDGLVAVMAVAISTEPTFTFGKPTALFEGSYRLGTGQDARSFDTADGQRFLMIKEDSGPQFEQVPIMIVRNWFSELERLVPIN